MEDTPEIRLDKWLWSVRVHATRAAATEACRMGRVSVDGLVARPARHVRPGQVVAVNLGIWTRTLRVLGIPPGRVGAALVPVHAEDLTPPAERERARERSIQNLLARPVGGGRPTKRLRRDWDRTFGV